MGRLVLLLSCLVFTAACSKAKKARELSKEAVEQIEDHFELRDERELATVWGAALLDRVVTTSMTLHNPSDYAYSFRVIEARAPNAFTTPDGHIYMTTGLIRSAESCAEIVGILGHEVGHVIEHHAVKRLNDTEAAGCMGDLVFGDSGAGAAFEIGGMILASTAFSREDEHEADDVGVLLTAEAGYAPDAIIDFFERMNDGRKEASFWSTHPAGAARIQAIRARIAELPNKHEDAPRDCHIGGITLEKVQASL